MQYDRSRYLAPTPASRLEPNSITILRALATPQPDGLSILLQLCNQLVALAHDVLILLVLVIRPVGLNDTTARDTVNGAGNAAGGDELSEVTFESKLVSTLHH